MKNTLYRDTSPEQSTVIEKKNTIKQLQDQLNENKSKVGRGGKLNNEKNMSSLR